MSKKCRTVEQIVVLLHNVFCTPESTLRPGLRLQCFYKRFQPYIPYPPPSPRWRGGGGGRIGRTLRETNSFPKPDTQATHRRFFFFSLFFFAEFRLECSSVPVCQSYVLVCTSMYLYISRMLLACYPYALIRTRMFLVCTRMSLACHPCGVLVTIRWSHLHFIFFSLCELDIVVLYFNVLKLKYRTDDEKEFVSGMRAA